MVWGVRPRDAGFASRVGRAPSKPHPDTLATSSPSRSKQALPGQEAPGEKVGAEEAGAGGGQWWKTFLEHHVRRIFPVDSFSQPAALFTTVNNFVVTEATCKRMERIGVAGWRMALIEVARWRIVLVSVALASNLAWVQRRSHQVASWGRVPREEFPESAPRCGRKKPRTATG